MTKESIPVRTILVEGNKVEVSKDSPPVAPLLTDERIVSGEISVAAALRMYKQALDKFKREAETVGNWDELVKNHYVDLPRGATKGHSGIYDVSDKGLVYEVKGQHIEGTKCMKLIAIVSFSPPEVKQDERIDSVDINESRKAAIEILDGIIEKLALFADDVSNEAFDWFQWGVIHDIVKAERERILNLPREVKQEKDLVNEQMIKFQEFLDTCPKDKMEAMLKKVEGISKNGITVEEYFNGLSGLAAPSAGEKPKKHPGLEEIRKRIPKSIKDEVDAEFSKLNSAGESSEKPVRLIFDKSPDQDELKRFILELQQSLKNANDVYIDDVRDYKEQIQSLELQLSKYKEMLKHIEAINEMAIRNDATGHVSIKGVYIKNDITFLDKQQ